MLRDMLHLVLISSLTVTWLPMTRRTESCSLTRSLWHEDEDYMEELEKAMVTDCCCTVMLFAQGLEERLAACDFVSCFCLVGDDVNVNAGLDKERMKSRARV